MFKKVFLLILVLVFPIVTQGMPISEPATLRSKLPDNIIGYVRIPSIWGLFSAPKDSSLQGALKNPQHIKFVEQLITSVNQNILEKSGVLAHPAIALFFNHLRSPIEAVALLPDNAPFPMVQVLLSAKLTFNSVEESKQFLQKLVEQLPELKVINEMSPDGYAMLSAGGAIPVALHYNAETHLISAMIGMSATQPALKQLLTQLAPNEKHPMYVLENQVDSTYQEYFQWINVQRILPLLQATTPPEELQKLNKWSLLDIRAIAMGWGTSNGKGRLKFMLDLPSKNGYRQLFSAVSNNLNITSAGKPKTIAVFGLPMLTWLKGLETILQQETSPTSFTEYQTFKEKFKQETGFPIEELLQAVGHEMVFFNDEVGEFFAVRVNDSKQLEKILTELEKKYGFVHETKVINDKTYHHLSFALMSNKQLIPSSEMPNQFVDDLLRKIKAHYYWVEDEGYLVFAQIPQLLLDRQKYQERLSLQTSLEKQRRQNPRSSLLLFSTTTSDISRHLYSIYLKSLVFLADLAGDKIDLFSLPSPRELQLPAEGIYGMQIDVADSLMSLEVTFENNPLEFILGGNSMTGFAAVGIIAAVAIPAYSDYLKRSQVAEGIGLLAGLKIPAEEFYMQKNQLPTVEEIGGKTSGQYAKNIRLLESKNGYSAEFNNPEIKGKVMLIFDPKAKTWKCTSEGMTANYLPTACK